MAKPADHYCIKCCGPCESIPFHEIDHEVAQHCDCSWCADAALVAATQSDPYETLKFVRQHFDPKATSVPNAQTCLRRIDAALSELRTQTSDNSVEMPRSSAVSPSEILG